jgi:hypothetical protein
MSKRNRVPRPKDELRRELADQLQLLRIACQHFDSGVEPAGKHIALSLRVLLHEHGSSKALMEQLGMRGCWFFDSAGALNPRNLLTEHPFLAMQMKTEQDGHFEARYIPVLDDSPHPNRRLRFVEWWNQAVIKDQLGHRFSRRELILNVADTDGGAHVDPELDAAYMELSRKNSLGWTLSSGEPLKGRPELACVRQIAHELLKSISRGASPATETEQSRKP